MTAFCSAVSRQIGLNDLPLDYLMRPNLTGNYNGTYASREAKLKECILLTGPKFDEDSK